MPLTIDEDEGYLDVDVRLPDGSKSPPVRLDLFEATNAYAAIHAEYADLVARGAAWCEWLAEKGLPGLSHGKALALAGHMRGAVEEFVKKNRGLTWETPGSPDSTASPSAD